MEGTVILAAGWIGVKTFLCLCGFAVLIILGAITLQLLDDDD